MQIDLMEEPIGEYEKYAKGIIKAPCLVDNDHIEQYQYIPIRKNCRKSCVRLL